MKYRISLIHGINNDKVCGKDKEYICINIKINNYLKMNYTTANEIVHKNYSENLNLPEDFRLYQNFPQSFYRITRIAFEIPRQSNVRIAVYDVFGRDVDTLLNKQLKAGSYEIKWNASNLTAGIYYYKIYADEFVDAKKILLLKKTN